MISDKNFNNYTNEYIFAETDMERDRVLRSMWLMHHRGMNVSSTPLTTETLFAYITQTYKCWV